MAKTESYELAPHRDIVELNKNIQKLISKIEASSSQKLLNSMDLLTKNMDSMLKLFTEASKDIEVGGENNHINEKLDKVIDQNKVIPDDMIAVYDLVKDFTEKQKTPELRQPSQPGFQPPIAQEPNFQQPPKFEPQFGEPPQSQQPGQLPMPQHEGPVAMPSIPFPGLDEPPKPKKRGLFGRFKK
jgi:hypothetical protein